MQGLKAAWHRNLSLQTTVARNSGTRPRNSTHEDGVPQFFEDIYGYDRRQLELMRLSTPLPQNIVNSGATSGS